MNKVILVGNIVKCYINVSHYFCPCVIMTLSRSDEKYNAKVCLVSGKTLKSESILNILLCWYISLLNETSHIFGSTDSCILYIRLKMPWQPCFLGNWRIICVVHFLYHKWSDGSEIKCYETTWRKKN